MAEMLVQSESLTSIADKIRVLSGTEDGMSLSTMENYVDDANADINTEADLIAQIAVALKGKAVEGGDSLPEEIVLPTLSNPATSSDMLLGKQLINADCEVVTGTIPSQGAKTVTPSSVQQTAISAGTYASGTVTVAAIPSDYKKVQIVSNKTFTTDTNGRATIELGFKPDIVTLTFNEAYHDSDTRYTYQMDTSVDFYHGGSDHISASTWYREDYVTDFYVDRTDSGFEVMVWKYNSDLSSASGFRRATVTYSAIKFS